MPRTKIDDAKVYGLGQYRSSLQARIQELEAADIQGLRDELAAVETELKTIDPSIPTLAEEAATFEADLKAAEKRVDLRNLL